MAEDVDWNAAPGHKKDRQSMVEADEINPQQFWFLHSLARVRHSIKSLCRSAPEHKVDREVVGAETKRIESKYFVGRESFGAGDRVQEIHHGRLATVVSIDSDGEPVIQPEHYDGGPIRVHGAHLRKVARETVEVGSEVSLVDVQPEKAKKKAVRDAARASARAKVIAAPEHKANHEIVLKQLQQESSSNGKAASAVGEPCRTRSEICDGEAAPSDSALLDVDGATDKGAIATKRPSVKVGKR